MTKFEQQLADRARERPNICFEGVLDTDQLNICGAVYLSGALKALGVSPGQILWLLDQHVLPQPGLNRKGRPAWRQDEIRAAEDHVADLRDDGRLPAV